MRKGFLSCTAALVLVSGFATAQKIKSTKEQEAYLAIQKEQTPDGRINKALDFVSKFKDSEMKSLAYQAAAEAADMKGDSTKAILYAQDAMEADAKNYAAMLLIAGELAQHTRENDLDKTEKLTRAEKLANDALAGAATAEKPADNKNITDAQWADYKKDLNAQGHRDLGLIAVARKKMDVAATEFKASLDSSDQPDVVTQIRLADALLQSGKADESLAMANKVLATPNLPAQLKPFAESIKKQAESRAGKK